MRRFILGAFSLFFVAPGTAVAEPLQPVSKWDLNYGDTDCAAIRNYGSAAEPITLAIRPSPTGETYEILVGRRRFGPQFAQELEGSVDFGNGPIKAWLLHYATPKKFEVYQFRIKAAEFAQARSARAVSLHIKDAPDFAFTLESIPQLLAGLDACTVDLKRYWNMDGEKDGRIAKLATGDIRKEFSSDDYPSEAFNRQQEGTAQFLLLVDEKGKVAGCHVTVASGVPALDAMGCVVIVQRAKLNPALDSAGKPVRSTVTTPPVRWQIAG